MGFKNRAGKQGFVTEDKGKLVDTSFVIENLAGAPVSNVLKVDPADGTVQAVQILAVTGTLAGAVRYEYHAHSGVQTIPDAGTYVAIQCDGLRDSVNGGLSLWDTTNNVFKPTLLGGVYTIRFTGKTGNIPGGGNSFIHLDFQVSGSIADVDAGYQRHYQGRDFATRANAPDIDLSTNFVVFADADLIASGAQLYANTGIGGGVSLVSCSIMIKEG